MLLAQLMTWLLADAKGAAAQNSNPKQTRYKMWQPPGNCSAITETCLGTSVWCSDPTRYQEENHVSRDSCIEDREGTRAWEYPAQVSCPDDSGSAACSGTDALCAAMDNADLRGECFRGHQEAEFLQPGSTGCLRPESKRRQDERCVGTAIFCAAKERQEAYGSARDCVAHRRRPQDDAKQKQDTTTIQQNLTGPQDHGEPKQTLLLPWLEPPPTLCQGGDANRTETCVGTEAACQGQPACLDARESPAFQIKPTSDPAACRAESCLGTWEWCLRESQTLQYPNKADCLLRRGLDLREASRQAGLLYGPVLRDVVTRALRNVTLGAVFRSQILAGQGVENLTAEAARSCRVFLQGLASEEGEVFRALRTHVKGALGLSW